MVDSFENKLIPSDSYSFMMVAIMFSKTWFVAFCVCVLQLCMYAFVLIEQLDSQTGEFIALIVGTNVSIAQLFALIVTTWLQDDVFVAALIVKRLWHRDTWGHFFNLLFFR